MVGDLERRWDVPVRVAADGAQVAAGVAVRHVADREDRAPQGRVLPRPEEPHLARRAEGHQVESADAPEGLLEARPLLRFEAGGLVDDDPQRRTLVVLPAV